MNQKQRLQNIKMIMKDGDILLIENLNLKKKLKDTIISGGIQYFTNSRFNHSAWISKYDLYHWTMWTVKHDPLKKFIKKTYKLVILRYDDLTPIQCDLIRAMAISDYKKKKKYSVKSYLGFSIFAILRKFGFGKLRKYDNPWRVDGQKVCSSGIIDRWFKTVCKIDLCPDLGMEQVTPRDIYESSLLRIIYEEE